MVYIQVVNSTFTIFSILEGMLMASKKIAKVGGHCVACGTCVRSCPRNAIYICKGVIAKVNINKCVGCGICASDCPSGAIILVLR